MKKNLAGILRILAADPKYREIARKSVEDVLVALRDDRISIPRNNGLVIKEHNGAWSGMIRLGMEDAFKIALEAIADELEAQ